jgi:hypothetical protein
MPTLVIEEVCCDFGGVVGHDRLLAGASKG